MQVWTVELEQDSCPRWRRQGMRTCGLELGCREGWELVSGLWGTGPCLGCEGLGGKPEDLDCGLPKLPRWVCGGRAGVGVRSAPVPNPVPHPGL